jgi:hypothetical protein
MSRLGPIAFLVVLSSVAAASACCIFKCCYKSAAVPVEGQGVEPSKMGFGAPTIKISSVGGQSPVANDIPSDIDPRSDLTVTVDYNFDPTSSDPELQLTDNGPRSSDVPEKLRHKKYKPKIIHEKPKVTSTSPSPGPGPPVAKAWEAIFVIPSSDLTPSHKYSLAATAGSLASATVTFRTGP